MWMVDPEYLCRKHLLGEHNEIHKHRHNFVKQHSITNRIKLNQIEPKSMKERHDALAKEMLKRGYNHKTPYEIPDISYLPEDQRKYTVNVNQATKELVNKCPECKKRMGAKIWRLFLETNI
jgi:hypothetical protein